MSGYSSAGTSPTDDDSTTSGSTKPKVGASNDVLAPADGAAAAQDLDADAVVQALVDNPDAFPMTSQATGGLVQVRRL